MLENLSVISFIFCGPHSWLTKVLLKQLTNIQHPLSGGLDQRRSRHVGVGDPADNDQAKQDRRQTYRRRVITLSHGRALWREY